MLVLEIERGVGVKFTACECCGMVCKSFRVCNILYMERGEKNRRRSMYVVVEW